MPHLRAQTPCAADMCPLRPCYCVRAAVWPPQELQASVAKEVASLRTLSSDVRDALAGMQAAMSDTPRVLEETRGAVRQVAADAEQLHKAVAGACTRQPNPPPPVRSARYGQGSATALRKCCTCPGRLRGLDGHWGVDRALL
jgi:hypothetical protein